MTNRLTPRQRLEHLDRAVLVIARLRSKVANVGAHLAAERAILDGYPSGEGLAVSATAELTSVEAAADARLRLDIHEDDIDAGLHLLLVTVLDLDDASDRTLGLRAARHEHAITARCNGGSGRDGAEIPWVPHSRDPDNGWADPTCTDMAAPGRGGLCSKCSLREDRWRRTHQLPPRSHVAPAAGEVA